MTEHEFDRLLETAAPELPPDDIAAEVTPWRRAIGYILGGSAMCAITLNFLSLNVILPTIGVILQLIGFRSLRRENGWFRTCWLLAVLRAVLYLPCVVLNATIYSSAVYASPAGAVLTYGMVVIQLLLFFCFWRALLTVQRRAGAEAHAGSAAALLVWYAAALALGWVQYNGLLLGLVMLGCYILILRSLSALSKEMEESGYALTPAPVRVSDGVLVRTLAAVLAVGIACGYLFFGSYRMDWQREDGAVSAEAAGVRAELLALGYPEAALADLSESDLLACRGAVLVVAHETDKPMNDGREVRTSYGSSTHITTVYDVEELHLTDVAVLLTDEPEHWLIFHHFRWTEDTRFCGTELVRLWPIYREDYRKDSEWTAAGELMGRVLYDDASGGTYVAPYASLALEGFTATDFFGRGRYVEDIFATFSMPLRGENQRGYVAYGARETSGGSHYINSWTNYTHQEGRFQYPVQTAKDSSKAGGWGDRYPFRLVQDALQFDHLEDGSICFW